MTKDSVAAWKRTNEPLIAEFRASGGRPKRRKWPLLLLTTIGRQSRKPLVTPLYYTTDDDRFVVVASNGGAPRNPGWFHNLRANPTVIVEVGGEEFRARARITHEPDRTRLLAHHARFMPFYEGFVKRTKARRLPVVVLERIGTNDEAHAMHL
jgi:deazaflavin-dependent oxidoreductase (nitroreductase family)